MGDKVEALYYSGQTWYPACVSACRLTADGLSWCYDLAYDDGDREKKVGEAKVRLPGGAAEPAAAAAAPAAAAATPVPAVTDNGKAQTKSKTGSNSNSNNNSSSSNQQQQQPAASLPPAELAALLRAMTREVLRGQAEYKAAFAAIEASSASDAGSGSGSGAGLGGSGAHVSGSASLLALTRFAEDMLTEPLAGEAQAAALYALMDVDGSGLVTLDDFMRFLAGEVRTAAAAPGTAAPAPVAVAAAAPVAAKPPLQQQQQQQKQQQQQQQPVAEVASEQASVVSAVDSDLAPFGLGLGSDGLGLGLGQGLGCDGDAAGEVDSEGSMGLGLDGGGHVDIGDAEAEYGDEFDD